MIRSPTLPRERRPRMRPVQLDDVELLLWQSPYRIHPWYPTSVIYMLGPLFLTNHWVPSSIFRQWLLIATALLMSYFAVSLVSEIFRWARYAYTLTGQRIILSARASGRVIAEIALEGLDSEVRPCGPTLWLFPRNPELSINWPFRYRTARRMPGLADPQQVQKLLSAERSSVVVEFALGGDKS